MEESIEELFLANQYAKSKRDPERIKAVHAFLKGYSTQEIAAILILNEKTITNYIKLHKLGGLSKLLENRHQGSRRYLSDDEINILTSELDSNIYLTTSSIISFVSEKFSIKYSTSGMRDLLHHIGYEYKKPKLVPGNPSIDSQNDFIEHFEQFMGKKPKNVEVLFMDAVHPEHNTMAAYGWLKRGEKRTLKTNCGRQRLNLHGAINAETEQLTVIESKTINAESTVTFLSTIEKAYPRSKNIYIILDNAPYHHSKIVKAFLENSRIKLVFLPPYSPNLNLIEPIWKLFKKNVLYNKYHETLSQFRNSAISFFQNIGQYANEISAIMEGGFQSL